MIGDPDQSIYGFRGADAECFENLKKLYSDLEVISLKENYWSSPQILCAADPCGGRTYPDSLRRNVRVSKECSG